MLCATCTKNGKCRKKEKFEDAVESTYLQQGVIPEEPLEFDTCDGAFLVWTPETGISAKYCSDYEAVETMS